MDGSGLAKKEEQLILADVELQVVSKCPLRKVTEIRSATRVSDREKDLINRVLFE